MTPVLRRRALLAAAGAAAASAGLAGGWVTWRRLRDGAGSDTPGMAEAAAAFFATTLPDPDGTPQAFAQWKGRVIVANFWATWCVPCREEMPHFVKMQDRYGERGLTFVGIAIDRAERVSRFAKEIGVNYPLLVGDMSVFDLARKAGNLGDLLPYTVIFDRSGKIVARRAGIYTEATLSPLIEKLL
ncbi:MAG: TlpA family protein disulfide reductase [bacterium]|jgi:thiol-disulfide isomerase/thioredoxin|nr:TlpA family protein disulfide reductase [Betaproteobacteria bacterium]